MKETIEVGYLAGLYSEAIYSIGASSTAQTYSVETKKEEVKPLPVMEVKIKTEMPSLSKIPTAPSLQKEETKKIAKKCLILYTSKEEGLSNDELLFLEKVMAAVKLTSSEYELVYFEGITIQDVAARYSFDKIVLFNADIPNLSIGKYACTQVKSTKIIAADALWMVASNPSLKKQLWDQLRVMFGIS